MAVVRSGAQRASFQHGLSRFLIVSLSIHSDTSARPVGPLAPSLPDQASSAPLRPARSPEAIRPGSHPARRAHPARGTHPFRIPRLFGVPVLRAPHLLIAALIAASAAAGGGWAAPSPASAAATVKVVVIVGPVESQTARYISIARELASEARSYGARVYEIYSPNATWSRVVRASQGANLLIYLGHGNGFPSPYGPFNPANDDGFGLNAVAGAGNSNQTYYGESRIERSIRLAPNAVVLLNHLCYASGNAEWGKADPSRSVAIHRVDNYGAGFLRAGAAAVIADGLSTPSYVLRGLFGSDRTLEAIFWSSDSATNAWTVRFASQRTPGSRAIMDPYRPNGYYRSIIGQLDISASQWR